MEVAYKIHPFGNLQISQNSYECKIHLQSLSEGLFKMKMVKPWVYRMPGSQKINQQ